MENRRGFLATLGKLAAAVGIMTAAATVSTKVKPGGKPIIEKIEWGKPMHEVKPRTTRYPISPTVKRVLGQSKIPPEVDAYFDAQRAHANPAQEAINNMTNAMLDNARQSLEPQMVVSMKQYEAIMKAQQIQNLDPYKWGEVFDLKWIPFKPKMNMEAYEGWWEARVKRDFQQCFKNEIFRVNVMISTHEMKFAMNENDHARNAHMVSMYKENAYRKIVEELQRVIRLEAGPEELYAEMSDHPSMRDLSRINGKFTDITA